MTASNFVADRPGTLESAHTSGFIADFQETANRPQVTQAACVTVRKFQKELLDLYRS
ncbi:MULTISPECIES: hypothetical protein [Streptomyces]|uniref:Uncharacterized protein n=1 Tax=Streptomyces achmelvichensis TaxID=3134111 RepID=A0ACC6Q2Q6_9ACTN|nr:hypothetical protein OG317_27875 [Streptomyces sp. NBC_01167]